MTLWVRYLKFTELGAENEDCVALDRIGQIAFYGLMARAAAFAKDMDRATLYNGMYMQQLGMVEAK